MGDIKKLDKLIESVINEAINPGQWLKGAKDVFLKMPFFRNGEKTTPREGRVKDVNQLVPSQRGDKGRYASSGEMAQANDEVKAPVIKMTAGFADQAGNKEELLQNLDVPSILRQTLQGKSFRPNKESHRIFARKEGEGAKVHDYGRGRWTFDETGKKKEWVTEGKKK